MLARFTLLFVVFFSTTLWPAIFIDENFSYSSSADHQIAIEDKDGNLTAADVLNGHYKETYNGTSAGFVQHVFWSKIVIKNISQKDIGIMFKNQKAGTDKIDAYVYSGGKLIQTAKLGDMRDIKERLFPSPFSVFFIELDAGQEVTVVTRFENLGTKDLLWDISDTKTYASENSLNIFFYGIFGGIVFALVIYNFMMYKSLRDISFIFYIVHIIAAWWYQYAYSGTLYFLDLGINLYFLTISTWITATLSSLTLLLFAFTFFKIKEQKNLFFATFKWLLFFNALAIIFVLYQLIDPTLLQYTLYLMSVPAISFVWLFIFSIFAIIKGNPNAKYFFIGESLYMFSYALVLLSMLGVVNGHKLDYYFIPVGIVCEMIFISMSLSQRVREIRDENEANNRLLAEENKFSAIGRGIGNVTHQWKEPLTQLNSNVVYLQALHYAKDDKKLLSEFTPAMHTISEAIDYMKGSIDELYYFYSGGVESVNLKKQINLAFKLQQDKLIPNDIEVKIECDDFITISGSKHSLANVLMIFFDNSIQQLLANKITNPTITITVLTNKENNIILNFEDNAGGVSVRPIEKVFEIDYTTKGEGGTGMGLSLAKKIVTQRLNGTIAVSNSDDGAVFSVHFAS